MTSYRMVPRFQFITDITNAQNAVVTCEDEHDFSIGELVSFRVERANGMREINNRQGKVLEATSDTITVDIDTMNFTPFIYPPVASSYTPAVVVPSASGVIPGSNPPTVNLEDCFDNTRT